MKKDLLYVDVVRASMPFYLNNKHLVDFKYKDCKKPFYYKNITLENGAVITVGYYRQFYSLFVKCSIPKVVYGDNRNLAAKEDLSVAVAIVNDTLTAMGIQADFSLFSVSNIEITYNYLCSTETEKQAYIDIYNKQYVPRRQICNYDESSVHKNRSCRTTVYDKSAEILYRDKNAVLSAADKRILRLEHKLRKRVMNKYYKNCLVKDLVKIDLKEVLKKENKKAGLDMITINEAEFYEILNEKIKHRNNLTKQRIITFYKELNEYGEMYVKSNHSPYIFRSYRKIMLEAGFSTLHIPSRIKNIIDFQNVERATFVKLTKQKIKNIIDKIKGDNKQKQNEKPNIFKRMVESRPFCLLCKIFTSISEMLFDSN